MFRKKKCEQTIMHIVKYTILLNLKAVLVNVY